MNRKNPEMSFERTGIKGGSKFTARSSLFGGPGGANGIRSSTSASTSVGSQYSTEYDEQVQALQEQENDQHLEKLKQGVEYLGQISIKIGDEIRDQNRLLDQMVNHYHHGQYQTKHYRPFNLTNMHVRPMYVIMNGLLPGG
eukprot:GEZU01023394.1.p1 GENE.GEZU01023394.1~~GEZU01023394.1.p1  ORF type:complete len:141 (-),score=2.12 GEZU01023394.1:226-648(-)